MTVYKLIQGVTATQTVGIVQAIDGSTGQGTNPIAKNETLSGSRVPSYNQAVQVKVSSPSGTVSVGAAVQVIASNDGVNFLPVGQPISVTPGTGVQSAGATFNESWEWWGAYVTALSGDGAIADCLMSM